MSDLHATADNKITGVELSELEYPKLNVKELQAIFENKVMEPAPRPSKRDKVMELASGPSKGDKVMKPSSGPSKRDKVMEPNSGPSKGDKVMKPTPVPRKRDKVMESTSGPSKEDKVMEPAFEPSKGDKVMKPTPLPRKRDKVMEATPGPSKGDKVMELAPGSSKGDKIMEPTPGPSKGDKVLEPTPGPSKGDKVMELAPVPCGQGSPDEEVFDLKMSELPATPENKVMELVPTPNTQEINIRGNVVNNDLNCFSLQNIHTRGGDININISGNASDRKVAGHNGHLGSRPLIHGFPTRLEDEECIGREDDIKKLLELVKKEHHVLVRGCGGIGKTTLVMKCAETWIKAEEFQYAALLIMENEQTVKTSFIALAEECKLKLDNDFLHKLRSFYDKLNKKKIIIIFDNIDDIMAIQPYLPSKTQHPNIFVLGTSQHDIPRLFHGYKLSELPQRAAVALVKGILNSPTDIPEALLIKLVQSLDCLALMVRQAASSIYQDVENGENIVKAIENYIKESSARLNDQIPQEFINNYGKTVYVSLQHNISKCIKDDKLAKRLLLVISYLDPTCISKDMLRYVPGVAEVIKKLIQRFVKYSMVAEEEWKLTIHRTTQAIIRCAYANDKAEALAYMFHMILTCDRWGVYWSAHSHLAYVLPEMSKSMLTQGYRSLFTSDKYKWKREKLEGYEEGLVLEWEAPQFAAYLSHWDVLARLRELSSPDTWVTESGWTWIHAAALRDQADVLNKYMIDSSTKNKKIIKTGHTALHLAAIEGSYWIITELIRMGVDLNTRDIRGDSALYIALSRGHSHIALEMLEAGSEINQKSCSKITATYTVIKELKFPSSITGRGYKVDIQYLYNIVDGEEKLMRPETLSILSKFADTSRNTEVLKEIQDKSGEEFGAVLEAVDWIWEAAVLAFMYMRQHQLTVHELVEEISGERYIPGVRVLYPPHAALCSKALAFTKLLLNKIKNTSSDAVTILTVLTALPCGLAVSKVFHYLGMSAEKGLAAIEVLQGYGIWYGTFTPFTIERTYIHKLYGTEEMRSLARVYITLEELPSDTRISLFTIVLCRLERFEKNLARFVLDQMTLQELTSAYERVPRLYSYRRWPEVLERLQKAGCRIEPASDVKWSPLHYAVVFDFYLEYVIEKLMKLGVEVNVRGPGGITPLHMVALCLYKQETVPLLVKKGAQVNAVTHEGLTPLHIATSSEFKDEIHNLLEAGADPQIKDKKGRIPLDLASSWTRDPIINLKTFK